MKRITPFLWFDGVAEDAAKYYVSIFEKSKILEVRRYSEGAPAPAGSVMSVTFRLDGREFIALNGGPHYQLTPAFSMFVLCETQAEVDKYWAKLSKGGEPQRCGWLTDKFGLSWQIVPAALGRLLGDKDPERARRAMEAMLGMVKLNIAQLERAADGGARRKRVRAS